MKFIILNIQSLLSFLLEFPVFNIALLYLSRFHIHEEMAIISNGNDIESKK